MATATTTETDPTTGSTRTGTNNPTHTIITTTEYQRHPRAKETPPQTNPPRMCRVSSTSGLRCDFEVVGKACTASRLMQELVHVD